MMHQGHFCNFRHFCPGSFLTLQRDCWHCIKTKTFSFIAKSANIDEFLKLELESLKIRFFNYLQCGA